MLLLLCLGGGAESRQKMVNCACKSVSSYYIYSLPVDIQWKQEGNQAEGYHGVSICRCKERGLPPASSFTFPPSISLMYHLPSALQLLLDKFPPDNLLTLEPQLNPLPPPLSYLVSSTIQCTTIVYTIRVQSQVGIGVAVIDVVVGDDCCL